jgi:hypothetical protein
MVGESAISIEYHANASSVIRGEPQLLELEE